MLEASQELTMSRLMRAAALQHQQAHFLFRKPSNLDLCQEFLTREIPRFYRQDTLFYRLNCVGMCPNCRSCIMPPFFLPGKDACCIGQMKTAATGTSLLHSGLPRHTSMLQSDCKIDGRRGPLETRKLSL